MIYEKNRRYIIPFSDVPTARAEMPEIEAEERSCLSPDLNLERRVAQVAEHEDDAERRERE